MTTARPPITFLLVDDLEDNLIALRALLEEQPDVRLLLARSGREALELLLVNDVALALVDVQMPEMDGFELAELMRGKEQTKNIPIIFITAGSRDAVRVFRGYDAGAVDFLFKPIEPFILRHKANVFMQLFRQRETLRQVSERLAEELRLNETFVAAVSHDLRSPLNGIMMAAELLLAAPEPDAVRKNAERVRANGRRMGTMIEDLLDLARARLSGGIPIAPTHGDLHARARKAVAEQQASQPERLIELSSTGDVTGEFDGNRLEQVISNLVGNAVAHGTKGTPIRVQLDGTRSDRLLLSVQNGGAIDPALVPRLFDPFRAGEPGRQRSSGLGLGLYIVSQIVKRHSGAITVESTDNRVVFTVDLPRHCPAAP